jgi:hypothetical protein
LLFSIFDDVAFFTEEIKGGGDVVFIFLNTDQLGFNGGVRDGVPRPLPHPSLSTAGSNPIF